VKALLFLLVVEGRGTARLEADGSAAALLAAETLRKHVLLLTGVSLPMTGTGPALRFRSTPDPGYAIDASGTGAEIAGRDLLRATVDLLEGWGWDFERNAAAGRRSDLAVEARRSRPRGELWVESEDWTLPATGLAIRGLSCSLPEGVRLRVASESFDDFLPVALFETHPDWFARRGGEREPRGNFCLTDAGARAACLDAVGAWLEAHPAVEALGLFPEVTEAWCECDSCGAIPRAEAYALLWREAAARFPDRTIEILATGATLAPPAGAIPRNIEVRLRPGRDGCGLHGLLDPSCPGNAAETAARWNARVVVEMDGAPDSWCGMPWPCEEAVRRNAEECGAGVLRHPRRSLARLWHDPRPVAPSKVHTWGDPQKAADFDFPESEPLAYRIAANERAFRAAMDGSRPLDFRRAQATEAWGAYHDLPEVYRRYRGADFRRMAETLFPEGIVRRVGPASVRESPERVEIETDLLRLSIDARTAVVVSLQRKGPQGFGRDVAGGDGGFFSVVAIDEKVERDAGAVRIESPEAGRLRIALSGRLHRGGARWTSTLELGSASPSVAQRATVDGPKGIAVGCRWTAPGFDRWLCPVHAAEGPLDGRQEPFALFLPPGSLVYCREGERGLGLALRLPDGGQCTLADGPKPSLVAPARATELRLEWILFTENSELAARE